jgi:hypothetical protein
MSLLSRVDVATPCRADWESMSGDDKKRFCSLCKLHVHNLSAMSEGEAEAFVRQAEVERAGGGRVCVRFYRRADGTVLTQDCPVGVAARVRRRVVAVRGALVALVAMVGGGAVVGRSGALESQDQLAWDRPFSTIRQLLFGDSLGGRVVMGRYSRPPRNFFDVPEPVDEPVVVPEESGGER